MFNFLKNLFISNEEKTIINEIISSIWDKKWKDIKNWQWNYICHNLDLKALKESINIYDKYNFYTWKTIKYLCELESGIEWHVENLRREKIFKKLSKDDKEKYKDFFRTYDEFWKKYYKKSVSQHDSWVCDICRINEEAWWIYFDKEFPSGHFSYPFHKWKESCRCYIQYSLVNPETGKLFDK